MISKTGLGTEEDAIFDNFMDGTAMITSKNGWKWSDIIYDLGMIMIVGFAILAPVAVKAAGGFAGKHARYAWIGGIWPAIFGAFVSLFLVVAVSKMSRPAPQDVMDIFFGDEHAKNKN
jgi:hypothetical protein